MSEQVYGLTEAAVKLLNQMADKHRQKLPDAGRRTRRVFGNDGGTALEIAYITDTSAAFYARGITTSVTCNSEPDGSGTEYTVYLQNEKGVWFPGERVIIGRLRDPEDNTRQWHMVQSGESNWFATAQSAITSLGNVRITVDNSTTGLGINAYIDVEAQLWDSTFVVEDGQEVNVQFDPHKGHPFQIIGATCPG